MDDYRPNLTDAEEEKLDMENALDDAMSYIQLAIDSIKEYRNFEDLTSDLELFLDAIKDEKRGLEDE